MTDTALFATVAAVGFVVFCASAAGVVWWLERGQ